MDKFMFAVFLGALIVPTIMSKASAAPDKPSTPVASVDFWDYSNIEWGDGRPYEKPVKKEGPYPQGFKADYKVEIPKTGWYELVFLQSGMKHDLLVDGAYAWHRRDCSTLGKDGKAGNIWLAAGSHTIRVQRVGLMGFPPCIFKTLEIRPSDGRPEACITAEKTLVDVVRTGEKLEIKVTGGGSEGDVTYELVSTNLIDKAKAPETVGEVSFSGSSSTKTKTVKINCPTEGAFSLGARIKGGKALLGSEFPIGQYAVVDVNSIKPASGKLQAVHVIDCVAQTDNGTAIAKEGFSEGNGPTRVSKSAAGSYRESHDSTPPLAPERKLGDFKQTNSSGFSYRLEVPEANVPYLLDIEFPDDARRSVAILGYGGYGDGGGKGYETGGMQPFTNTMKHHRVIFWPSSKQISVAIFSTQYMCRAAASKITVSRFEDGLVPASKPAKRGGRQFSFWFEEGGNWRHLVGVKNEDVADMFIGLDRLARFCLYFGCNGMSLPVVGYQNAYFRTDFLDGYGVPDYDLARLEVLFCEKYGMSYMPEVFPAQWYLSLVELPRRAEKPEDIRAFDCHGAERGSGSCASDLNALHPVVQKLWTDALGDLSDKLRDSPAFSGITARADEWLFRGDFNLPSINWGYGDWTIRQFEKDSGTKVPPFAKATEGGPGSSGDPQRFVQRFEFLMSKDMKDKWVKWRCDRIFEYHKRLRDRIRGDRDDLLFGIAGDFICDKSYGVPDTLTQRALECGVDVSRLKTEDGLALIPAGRYGYRSMGVPAQKTYDDFLSPEHVEAGMGVVRAFANYFNYQEFGNDIPWKALGFTPNKEGKGPYYCAACLASGRNSLEKYVVVLAQQDTTFTRDGGDNDPFGDPEIWNPWFAEYKALPQVPFLPLETAKDPVAVWFKDLRKGHKDIDSGFYFYAVNREQYPVTIDLKLKDAGTIVRLGTGEEQKLKDGVLSLELQPYELRSFKTSRGAEIVSSRTSVPAGKADTAKRRVAFAQDCYDVISGPLRDGFNTRERDAFRNQLDAAWDSVSKGNFWRARTALSMVPALSIYESLADIPEGQEFSEFPGMLMERQNQTHWTPKTPITTADKLVSPLNAGIVNSTDINPAWGGSKVLSAKDGKIEIDLDIPAEGIYALRVGSVAKTPGVTVASIGGLSLPSALTTKTPKAPETFSFPALDLKAGKTKLSFRRDGEFGIYAIQLIPKIKPTTNREWLVLGPFKSFYGLEGGGRSSSDEAVAKGLSTKYIPEDKVDLNAVYKNDYGKELRWKAQTDSSIGLLDDLVIGMSYRTGSPSYDINYAVTFITSDRDRTALVCIGADWWANAWLNGERLTSNISQPNCGADFNTTWTPYVSVMKLKKGVNTLLVKQHGGCFGSGIGVYISDSPGISCSASPGK